MCRLVALRQQEYDLNLIETVYLTHLHGDHFGGLPFLILDGQFRKRTADLTVVGPPGTERRLTEAMEACFPLSTTVTRRFAVRIIEHRERTAFSDDRATVIPYEVRHASGAQAFALRVIDHDTSSIVAYSGDTEWTEQLLEVADGAQVFLCEGYTPAPVPWHLDLGTLSQERDRFSCERLILTHMSLAALTADLTGWDTAFDGMTVLDTDEGTP